jgi:type II secretory pathway pseudopilin PulG
MRFTFQNSRSQRGMGLIGMLLSLVIGGSLVAGSIVYYQQAQDSAALDKNIQDITAIIGTAQKTYGSIAYSGLTTAAAINSRVIPSTLASNSTTAANQWGGAVTLVDNSATTAGTALLSYASVNPAQCQAIVSATHLAARRVQVGGTDVKPLDGNLNLATLTTQCQTAATIAWTIART